MFPDSIAAALVVAALGWLTYCYRQWEHFPEKVDDWITSHDQHRSGKQAALLTEILSFTLPDLIQAYLSLERAETDFPVRRDQLVAVAAAIDAEPAVHDVRIREDITKPVLGEVSGRIVNSLPRLVAEVVLRPSVLVGVQALGCYALDLDQYRRQKTRLAWRYAIQSGLLGLWLIGMVTAYLGYAPWWTAEAAVTVGLLPVLHGAHLEFRRQRLKADLSAAKADAR